MTVGRNIWDLGGSPSITCCYLRRRRVTGVAFIAMYWNRASLYHSYHQVTIANQCFTSGARNHVIAIQSKIKKSSPLRNQLGSEVAIAPAAGRWETAAAISIYISFPSYQTDFPIQTLMRALKFWPRTPLGFHFSVLSGTLHNLKN